jgi:flagellar basal body-associated protein FliL
MARSSRHTKKAPARKGKDIMKVVLIVAAVIGLMGIFAIDEIAGKVFFLVVAIVAGYLYWKRYITKNTSKPAKVAPVQPLQQFQRPDAPSQSTTPAEFVNVAGHRQGTMYEFVPVKVAGVTFKNKRRHRQTILRQIKWKDEPYDGKLDVILRQGAYEGQPTVEVWVNEEQIGFVPKGQVPFFVQNWHRLHSVFDFDVYGGSKHDDGERNAFGASFVARFSVNG